MDDPYWDEMSQSYTDEYRCGSALGCDDLVCVQCFGDDDD